jgi:hypothetical protein
MKRLDIISVYKFRQCQLRRGALHLTSALLGAALLSFATDAIADTTGVDQTIKNDTGAPAFDVTITYNLNPAGATVKSGTGKQQALPGLGTWKDSVNGNSITLNAPNNGQVADAGSLAYSLQFNGASGYSGYSWQWSDKNGGPLGALHTWSVTTGKVTIQQLNNNGAGVLNLQLNNYSGQDVTLADYQFGTVLPGYEDSGLSGDPQGLGSGSQLLLEETALTVPANGGVSFQVNVANVNADFGSYFSNGGPDGTYFLEVYEVPEPSTATLALLGLGALSLLACGSWRRSAKA